jgi:ABC-type uncharacterized transport system substrate-binding protein
LDPQNEPALDAVQRMDYAHRVVETSSEVSMNEPESYEAETDDTEVNSAFFSKLKSKMTSIL